MTETDSISLRFAPEFRDVWHAANVYDDTELFPLRRKVFDAALGIAAAAWFYFICFSPWWVWVAGIAVVPVLRGLLYPIRWSQCRAIWQSKLSQGLFEVTFDQEGMISQTKVGRVELKWESFQKLIESPRCFLLVYSKYGYSTIPRSAFSGNDEIARFRQLANDHISQH